MPGPAHRPLSRRSPRALRISARPCARSSSRSEWAAWSWGRRGAAEPGARGRPPPSARTRRSPGPSAPLRRPREALPARAPTARLPGPPRTCSRSQAQESGVAPSAGGSSKTPTLRQPLTSGSSLVPKLPELSHPPPGEACSARSRLPAPQPRPRLPPYHHLLLSPNAAGDPRAAGPGLLVSESPQSRPRHQTSVLALKCGPFLYCSLPHGTTHTRSGPCAPMPFPKKVLPSAPTVEEGKGFRLSCHISSPSPNPAARRGRWQMVMDGWMDGQKRPEKVGLGRGQERPLLPALPLGVAGA